MNTIVIGLGSNIHPGKNIKAALKHLTKELLILKQSRILKTKPIGTLNQKDFLNGAVLAETALGMDTCKSILKDIENKLNRKKILDKNGPRTIDLDILVWNNKIIDSDFYERDFIKQNVYEILPALSEIYKESS